MLLGLLIVGLGLSTVLVNRDVLGKETARTRLTQNLRGALDILGTDIRIAGENLSAAFPAVEITNGASGAPDTLTIRRNLLDEVLPLCTAIASGTTVTSIFYAIPGTVPGCTYSGHTNDYNAWNVYRTSNGNLVDAFIYNTVAKTGEFFKYTSETDGATSYSLNRTAGTWAGSYSVGASAVYVLEEWKYQMSSGILQVIQNRDASNPLNVSFGITDFQVSAIMQDGSTKTAFTSSDAWNTIAQIQIDITGQDRYAGRLLTKTVTGKFFPRNVLSN